MERKSGGKYLVLAVALLFFMGVSTVNAQWWTSSSSTSSSTSSSSGSSCPSGAICRPEAPGSYSGNGPYGYSTTTSLPGFTNLATIYYPRTATAPFAAIVFMQPYTGTQIMDAAWGPFFASHGIVYVNCDSTTTMDTVDQRATQQWSAYNAIKAANTRSGHVLRGKLNTSRIGVMGWSMGGGATWINASKSGPKTALSLAGHNLTAVSTAARGYSIKCPTLLMNGTLDTTYLGGMGQSSGVYTAIPSGIAKVLYEVGTAGHFDWGSPSALTAPYSGNIALAFQKAYLDGDTRWKSYISRPLDAVTWRTSGL